MDFSFPDIITLHITNFENQKGAIAKIWFFVHTYVQWEVPNSEPCIDEIQHTKNKQYGSSLHPKLSQ